MNVVRVLVLFLSLIWSWLVCLCCIWKFSFCRSFCGKLLFRAISCINVHSFCFLFDVSGRECILVVWCLTAETLCSTGWFERKLMVLSVVVRLRNMSISDLHSELWVDQGNLYLYYFYMWVWDSCLYVFGLCIYWWGQDGFFWCHIHIITISST